MDDIPAQHTPVVLSEGFEPTCTETGLTAEILCDVCGEILQEAEEILALGHDLSLTKFDWSEDSETCQAIFTCARCASEMRIDCEVTSATTEPTCTEDGEILYTAAAEFDGETYTSGNVVTLPATGHEYGDPTYDWAEDGSACAAEFTCAHGDDTLRLDMTVTSEVLSEPTDFEMGETKYTASLTFQEKDYEDVMILNDIPAFWNFSEDGKMVTAYNGTATDLVIPDGVTSLSGTIFKNNTLITSIHIPDSVTTLSGQQFFGATSLEEVWLPDELGDISSATFYNVKAKLYASLGSKTAKALSLRSKSFTIEETGWTLRYKLSSVVSNPTAVYLVSIPDDGEAEITIPEAIEGIPVTQIMSKAYAGREGLTRAYIPESVTTIATDAFEGCADGFAIVSSYDAYARTYAIDNDITWIHDVHTEVPTPAVEPTCEETGLTGGTHCAVCGEVLTAQEIIPALGHDFSFTVELDRENGVLNHLRVCARDGYTIVDEAQAVSILALPNALTMIDEEAFSGDTSIQIVIVPEGCTSIGARAFAGCPNLVYISLPSTITSVADDAFEGSDNVVISWE